MRTILIMLLGISSLASGLAAIACLLHFQILGALLFLILSGAFAEGAFYLERRRPKQSVAQYIRQRNARI